MSCAATPHVGIGWRATVLSSARTNTIPIRGGAMKVRNVLLAAIVTLSLPLAAQQPATPAPIPQYGPQITLDQAKRAATAADAEARKNGWPMVIAIVDNAGQLVLFQRGDNAQTASVQVAQDKALSSAIYRRPTEVMQDAVAGARAGIGSLSL